MRFPYDHVDAYVLRTARFSVLQAAGGGGEGVGGSRNNLG